jgi:hypothetical protein
MKRSLTFVSNQGFSACRVASGEEIQLPVFPGILKHPMPKQLPELLRDERVAQKYTVLALQKAGWPILRRFPREWLLACMSQANLRPLRREALLYLLAEKPESRRDDQARLTQERRP